MATSNFDLGQSIAKYVQRVADQGSLTGSDAAELSSHLMDATDDLQRGGLSQEEAFMIGCKRLGDEQLLDAEYSKVNTSVKTNKIWAYLLLGFNLFYTVPSIIHWLMAVVYLAILNGFGTSAVATNMIGLIHILICLGIIYLVKQQARISKFIEKQVSEKGIRIVGISFLLFLMLFVLNYVRVPKFTLYNGNTLAQIFDSHLVENTYYLIFFTMTAGGLALVFNINKQGRLSLKSLFSKPSVLFLILLGLFTEALAGYTRAIPVDHILLKALIFGMVYFLITFIIAFYNQQKPLKYLLVFCMASIGVETICGIQADLQQGYHHTMYFVPVALVFIFIGFFMGLKTGKHIKMAER